MHLHVSRERGVESTRKDKAFFLNLAERAVFKLCGKDEESGGGVEGT